MAWSYEARLRAIGRLADAAQLSSVCISEFEEGFLVLGMGMTEQVGGVEPSPGYHPEGEPGHLAGSASGTGARQSAARQKFQSTSAHSSTDHGSAPRPMAWA